MGRVARRAVFAGALALLAPGCERPPAPPAAEAGLALPQWLESVERAVVAICQGEPELANIVGSGVIVSGDGLVLTADHVAVDEATQLPRALSCLRPDHPDVHPHKLALVRRFRAGSDGRDVALLRIEGQGGRALPHVAIGHAARVGDPVAVFGFPKVFGDVTHAWPLFRRGRVASTRYSYRGGEVLVMDLMGVDGLSGSPVIELGTRRVVGVFHGGCHKSKETGFSLAFTVRAADIMMAETGTPGSGAGGEE